MRQLWYGGDELTAFETTQEPDSPTKQTNYLYHIKTPEALHQVMLQGRLSPFGQKGIPVDYLLAVCLDHLEGEALLGKEKPLAMTITKLEEALLWYGKHMR